MLGSSYFCFGNENLKQATLCAVESPPYSSPYLPNGGPMIELIVNTLNLAGERRRKKAIKKIIPENFKKDFRSHLADKNHI